MTSSVAEPRSPQAPLTEAQRALIAQRLKNRTQPAKSEPIRARDGSAPRLMSAAMKRLFVLHHSVADLHAYNVAQVLVLTGPVDAGALERALDEIVRRHEILRTRMIVTGQGEEVSLGPVAEADFTYDDVASADTLEARISAETRHKFDLGSDTLLRARLMRTGPDAHVLTCVTHHIASDAVSKQIINRELATLYSAYCNGETESPLREPALQYADYAAWEAARLADAAPADAGKGLKADLAWWVDQLAGAPDTIELPLDRPRPETPTFRGARLTTLLTPELMVELDSFARKHRATRFMVLTAALAALLSRYSTQSDVVIGSPTSGRHVRELEEVVGLFLNSLPLRIPTGGSPSFSELVDRSRAAATGAYRHQAVPFDQIVEAIRPNRSLARNPIFQVMFTLKDLSESAPSLDGIRVVARNFESGSIKFDLGLTCYPAPDGGMHTQWQYSSDLFERSTIDRISQQFVRLLRDALSEPATSVDLLELIGPSELALLREWNSTDRPVRDGCLHDLISEQVERTPDAPAVSDEHRSLTYRELDDRANALAHRLQSYGVGPDRIVAVCLDRSVELEIALLAVLKAGGAYLPLDPQYPEERLRFMLEDSDSNVLITATDRVDQLPTHANSILIDEFDFGLRDSVGSVCSDAGPASLAYVIYTSGTTGRPKGVALQHQGLINRLDWMQREFQLTGSDVVLQKTPISFDVSVWELFWPLLTGASIFMARPRGHLDPRYLAETIDKRGVTTVHFVPSMLSAFLSLDDGAGRDHASSLRLAFASGEALPDATKEQFFRSYPNTRLLNLYGPTEASIDVTADECRPGSDHPVTIGRPIDNMQAYVLGRDLMPLPVGMPGQLCLGGVGLARGYLARPELTAERFVTGPEWLGPDRRRLYLTGDQARQRSDGAIEFLGRSDGQIKLRGLRIELGEISAVLANHPSVGEAACLVDEPMPGDQRLLAFVTQRTSAAAVDEATLRAHCRRLLPEYMVPNFVTVVPHIPLSPSGKADREALAKLATVQRGPNEHIAPRTATEARLATLWRQALGPETPPISVDDSFFDVGGHSLLALRLFRDIEKAFKIKLPFAVLFENVTVASMSKLIENERSRTEAWDTLVVLRESGTQRPLFFMPELSGEVLVYREMLQHLDGGRPVYGLQSAGLDGRRAPYTTIEAIAADCIQAMKSVQDEGPYLVAGYCFGGVVAYEVARQLDAKGDRAAYIGIIDASPLGRGGVTQVHRPLSDVLRVSGLEHFKSKINRGREVSRSWLNLQMTMLCGKVGLRTPKPFIQLIACNRRARLAYYTPDTDLAVTLFRASTKGSTEADDRMRQRWELAAHGGVTMYALEDARNHYRIVRSDFAGTLAKALNESLNSVD